MRTFPAQLRTADHTLDVEIDLDGRNVEIRSGADRLGKWSRSDCEFKRQAAATFLFRADGEMVNMRIPDDPGFVSALELIRTEKVQLVPAPLAIAGATAILAVVAFAAFGTATDTPIERTPTTLVLTTEPTLSNAGPVEETLRTQPPTADDLVALWNDLATGTSLELEGPGVQVLGAHLTVDVSADGIDVTATPSADPTAAEEIMASLGLSIAASDPNLRPADRTEILSMLGLNIHGSNGTPLDASISRGGVHYNLEFQPGEQLTFRSGFEW